MRNAVRRLTSQPVMWRQLWPAAKELGLAHHTERGFAAEAYSVNPVEMQSLELANRLALIGGYADGQLVGYMIWYLGQQFGEQESLLGRLGPWYIAKEFRRSRLGLRMADQATQLLASRGCRRLLWNVPAGSGAHWLQRRGAQPYEDLYLMELPQ